MSDTPLLSSIARAGRGLRWYLREATGEARWARYLERCEREGTVAMTRRDYERHLLDHRERHQQARCC